MPVDNKKLIQQSFDVIGKGDVAGLQQQLDPKLQNLFADAAKRARAAFPDMKLSLDDVITEGDKVVARWTMTGTHNGQSTDTVLGRVAPTKKPVRVTGITILRMQDGKIVETWGENSKMDGIDQLGLTQAYAKAVVTRQHPVLVQQALEQVFNQGNTRAAESFFAPNLAAAVRSGVEQNRTAFPDLKYTINHLEVVGDEVHFSYTATGTHKGVFQNHAATGRAIKWDGSATAKIADGLVSEMHVLENQWAKLIGLGLILATANTMTGNWGTNVLGIQISMVLTQTASSVSGTATTNVTGSQTFPVSGSCTDPDVHLQAPLDAKGNVLVFNGKFTNAKTVVGTYSLGSTTGPATLTKS